MSPFQGSGGGWKEGREYEKCQAYIIKAEDWNGASAGGTGAEGDDEGGEAHGGRNDEIRMTNVE